MGKTVLKNILAVIFSVSLIFILLITAFEAVCYWTPGYYEKEYTKYNVLEDINGEMTMDSVLDVTDEMMDYLHGRRDDLVVETTINGKTREFFNDREKAHMADVRALFIGAIRLRYIALGICALILILFALSKRRSGASELSPRGGHGYARRGRSDMIYNFVGANSLSRRDRKVSPFRILARNFLITCAAVGAASAVLFFAISRDFTAAFTRFHHIFFDNDLWLLDPETDNMINMLPEGFFSDTALRIAIYFIVMLAVCIAIAILILVRGRKKQR